MPQRHTKAAAFLLLTCVPLGVTPNAQATGFSGNIGMVSEYIFLGISQTDEKPALQGGISYEFSNGFYVNTWFSEIDYLSTYHVRNHHNYEMDFSTGYQQKLGHHWSAQISFTHYDYLPSKLFVNYQYNEYLFTTRYKDRFSASIGLSQNIYNRKRHSHIYELSAQYPLAQNLILNSGFGYHEIDKTFDKHYRYWNAGLSSSFGELIIDLSYFDTDKFATLLFGEKRTGSRIVLSFVYLL